MLGPLATILVAIVTFGRRTDRLAGPAEVIDSDTIMSGGMTPRAARVRPSRVPR